MAKLTSVCYLQILCLLVAFVNGSFILTSPKVIDAGSTVYFTLTVLDVPQGGVVAIRLLTPYEDSETIAESYVAVLSNYNMWVEMRVPPMSSDTTAYLEVKGSFSNGYRIDARKAVRIRHNTILTFVQTDKPLYKPGQTIRFRVLPMDNQLKPLSDDTVADVWIEDPSGIRVEQWKGVKFTEGIKQFELPLSDEPTTGTWKIMTEINKVSSTQDFRVEKYVLPKFEVVINPPKVIMADAETITVEICAKYTYGKIVDGMLSAKMTYEPRRWDSIPIPSVQHLGLISGCHDFVVNTDDLLLQTGSFGYRTLKIFAEVTENTTEIVRNATAQVEITHYPVYIDFVRNNGYYKQKLPYFGYLQVKKPDESPAASEKIQICARFVYEMDDKEICRIFTSNKNGMVPFSIAPTSARKISLKASAINYELLSYSDRKWDVKIGVPHASMELQPWYSPSDSYLQIETSTDEFQCDKIQQVKVRYTAIQGTTIKFYHQVLSKGRIVQQGSHQRTFYSKEHDEVEYDLHEEQYYSGGLKNNSTRQQNVGEFILSFNPRATMSPKARLLIYYVREDKEVVADSRMFYIKHCLLNEVSLKFRHLQQYPSTEATMQLSASPSSLCGISMVDKSVLLLEKDTTFNKDKIFKLMEDFDVGKDSNSRGTPCETPDEDENPDAQFRRRIRPQHGHFEHRPRDFTLRYTNYVDAVMAFEEAGMVVVTDLKINTRPCNTRPINQRMLYANAPVFLMRSFDVNEPQERSAVQGDFLTKPAQPVKTKTPKSTEEVRNYFPETWLWELHSVGSNGETSIKRQLPHTVTEWTGGAVCIHPKTGLGISDISSITAFQPFFLDFQLPYSVIRGESLPLIVTVFNYLSECLPIKLSLEPSENYKLLSEFRYDKVCVCGGQSVSSRFLIRPVTLGSVNITVYGFSIEDDDEICGNEITARLSARDAVTKPLLVEAEGFPKEEIFNYYICPANTNGSYAAEVDLLLPENVISDSSRAYMSVTGDVMGPALKGLKNLVRLPFGCGEQNMILFAPNIFVMDYLIAIDKITADIKGECIKNMKTGYQRELQYRHADGSYSAFGPGDKEGSLWLTAFVLRSFGQARRFISIDEKDLSRSVGWILKNQFENGCFKPSGTVFHKEMKGGITGGEQSLALLTAYVLISLLESGAVESSSSVIKNGLECLESAYTPDNYAFALFAYANALAKEIPMAEKYLLSLEETATIEGNQKYWESSSASRSVTVEIAGYYILARLEVEKKNDPERVFPVTRWITQQRNADGGFVSTQDTVVALQALAKYASLINPEKLDIGLLIESDGLRQGFKLDEDNKLVKQSAKIPILPAVVDLQVVGEGCALAQFSLRYNVETVTASEAFDFNVDVRRLGSSDCNLPILSICMRYKIPNHSSNMVVLSIKMATGFVPDEWSLHLLKNQVEVQLKRFDIVGNEVNLYFEELTNDQKCFKFHMKNEFEVEDVKPSIIRLYDYYQPELKISKEYTVPSTCNLTSLPELPLLPSIDFEPLEDYEAAEEQISDHKMQTMESPEYPIAPLDEDNLNILPSEWTTEMATAKPLIDGNEESFGVLADAFEINENSTHLNNFVDTVYDLDFPDGMEGNLPVSVEPPELDCPICLDGFPDNFTEVYCSSAFALKALLKDGSQGTVKILQDVSFFLDNPKSVRKFGKLEYEGSCSCPLLNEKGKLLLIVGSPSNLWNSDGKKHKILARGSVYVLSSHPKEIQTFITNAKEFCVDDP